MNEWRQATEGSREPTAGTRTVNEHNSMSRRAFIALTAIGLSFESDCRWMSEREQKTTMDQETVRQLLDRLSKDGQPRIRVALTRTR